MSERLTAEMVASLSNRELWERLQAESKRLWEEGESPARVASEPARGVMKVETQIRASEAQACQSEADLNDLIESRVDLCRTLWRRVLRRQEPAKE